MRVLIEAQDPRTGARIRHWFEVPNDHVFAQLLTWSKGDQVRERFTFNLIEDSKPVKKLEGKGGVKR